MCGLLGSDNIWKSGIWGCKNIKILRKSPLKLSKKNIFTVGNLKKIFMEHDLYLIYEWHKRQIDNFDPYNVLLVIATNTKTRATYDWFCRPGSHSLDKVL